MRSPDTTHPTVRITIYSPLCSVRFAYKGYLAGDASCVVRFAPAGWKSEHLQTPESLQPDVEESPHTVSHQESRSTWAKLIAQVYEPNPLVCPRCHSEMRIVAVITEPQEILKILRHLVKFGLLPPEFDPASLN